MPIKRTSLLRQLTDGPLDKPCSEPWTSMQGDERVRHCGACERDVYDLSAMTELEAEVRLLNASDVTPCIRYARDLDGHVVHRAAPRRYAPQHATAAAAALSVTLAASMVHATDRQPAQCIAYEQPAPAPPASAPPSSGAAMAPAAAPPSIPPIPPPLGGAPPPARVQPEYGTVSFVSKVARDVAFIGIELHAPLGSYRLTPGTFTAVVKEPNVPLREVTFTIKKDTVTTVDLDARPRKKK